MRRPATIFPPTRCSVMMRSRFSGVHWPYQTPSGRPRRRARRRRRAGSQPSCAGCRLSPRGPAASAGSLGAPRISPRVRRRSRPARSTSRKERYADGWWPIPTPRLRGWRPGSFEPRDQAVLLEFQEQLSAEPGIVGGVLDLTFVERLGPIRGLYLLRLLHL